MKNKITRFIKNYLPSIKKFFIQYSFAIIGIIIAVCGQITLGFVFLLTSFFIKMLVSRLQKDTVLEELLENSGTDTFVDEPFEGAVYVAALGICCTGNADFTSMQMTQNFAKHYTGDWALLSRIAFQSKSLNQDLIVECLASKVVKSAIGENEKNLLVVLIFGFLSVVEYNWNYDRGFKPSEYLAELLQRPLCVDKTNQEDLENAYKLLGLTCGVGLEKLKETHRYLVSIYHPDTLSALSEEQKEIASESFLRIQQAYEKILASL